jgi:uncharacterized membrane protein YdcZ (DUF606 family)
MPPDTILDRLLRHAVGLLIIGMMLVFLYLALLDPSLAALSEQAEGILVGGFLGVIVSIVNSIFTQESARQASRSATIAAQQGANAALSQPPAVSAVPPVPDTTSEE